MRKRLLLLFFMFSLLLFAGTKEEMYSAIENNNLNEVKKLITSGYEFDYQTIELTMLKDRIEIMKVFLATSNDSIQSYFDSGIIMGNIKSKNMLILLEKLGYTSDYTIGGPGGFARPYIYALEYNNEQGALILMKNGVDLLEDNGYGKILGNRALKIAREKSFKNAIGYWGYIGAFGVIAICISAIALFVKNKKFLIATLFISIFAIMMFNTYVGSMAFILILMTLCKEENLKVLNS